MSVVEYFLLFLSVIIGGGVAFYIKESNRVRLPLILSFSGAYLLSITVLHLMPSVFQQFLMYSVYVHYELNFDFKIAKLGYEKAIYPTWPIY